MTEIVVRRCTTEVFRSGGWSWGSDPRVLVDGVVAAVPELILREVASIVGDEAGGDVVIPGPLRVTVPVRLADLRRMADLPRLAGGQPADWDRTGALVAFSPTQSTARPGGADRPSRAGSAAAAGGRVGAEVPADGPILGGRVPGPDLLSVLVDAHRRGGLVGLLRLAPEAVVMAWLAALAEPASVKSTAGARPSGPSAGLNPPSDRATATVSDRPSADAAEVIEAIEAIGRAVASLGPLPDAGRRLAAVLVAKAELGLDPTDPAVIAAAAEPVGATPDPGTSPDRRDAASAAGTRPGPPALGQAGDGGAGRFEFEAADVPVIPFLLLGSLADLGVLAAVDACFGPDDRPLLPAFAAALAYKVLSPVERGWRRAAGDYHAAAAFAGRAEPVPDAELTAVAERAALLVCGPAAILGAELIERHRGRPVVVAEGPGGGVIAAEAAGLALLGWGGGARWSSELLDQLGRPATLGPGSDRHRLAAEMAAAFSERVSLPLAPSPAAERALAIVAAAALAAVAERLWGESEPTDPLLTLERLGDLAGSVVCGPERVVVRLPLGRRRADLFARRVIDDVDGVPWLGGRTVAFEGG